MYKAIASAVIVLVVVVSTVSAKCDVMKEFKPEVDDMSKWGKEKCEAGPELSEADMATAKKCYMAHVKPLLISSSGEAVDKFVLGKVLEDVKIRKVCHDKKVQDDTKKAGMKDVGMQKGMALKKEVEADCPKYKEKLHEFSKCIKG